MCNTILLLHSLCQWPEKSIALAFAEYVYMGVLSFLSNISKFRSNKIYLVLQLRANFYISRIVVWGFATATRQSNFCSPIRLIFSRARVPFCAACNNDEDASARRRKKTSMLQSRWHNPRQGTSAWIRACSKWRHFKLTGPRPAWLPFKEFRSMQTLGIYKGPDVLLPRRNQLRIPLGEFTCGRDKPRCRTRFPKFWMLLYE